MNDLELLKAKMRREPFRAFSVELISGATILIDSDAELLFPRKRPELVIAFTGNGLQHEFEEKAITRLIECRARPRAGRVRLFRALQGPVPDDPGE